MKRFGLATLITFGLGFCSVVLGAKIGQTEPSIEYNPTGQGDVSNGDSPTFGDVNADEVTASTMTTGLLLATTIQGNSPLNVISDGAKFRFEIVDGTPAIVMPSISNIVVESSPSVFEDVLVISTVSGISQAVTPPKFVASTSAATTIQDSDFASILSTLDSTAVDGDQVFMRAGTYTIDNTGRDSTNRPFLGKALTFVGEDRDTTIIEFIGDVTSSGGAQMFFGGLPLTLENLTIKTELNITSNKLLFFVRGATATTGADILYEEKAVTLRNVRLIGGTTNTRGASDRWLGVDIRTNGPINVEGSIFENMEEIQLVDGPIQFVNNVVKNARLVTGSTSGRDKPVDGSKINDNSFILKENPTTGGTGSLANGVIFTDTNVGGTIQGNSILASSDVLTTSDFTGIKISGDSVFRSSGVVVVGNSVINESTDTIDGIDSAVVNTAQNTQIKDNYFQGLNTYITDTGGNTEISGNTTQNTDLLQGNATKTHEIAGTTFTATGNIIVSGTVDGKDVAAHHDDSTIHFTEGSIDHLNIVSTGTDSHATIDAHIDDLVIHDNVTKEMFFTAGADTTGDYRGLSIAANGSDMISFFIPLDFVSISSLTVVAIPAGTVATVDIDLFSDYSANGEDAQNHSESDVSTTYSFTANQTQEVDISGVFSSIAAGDFCGIQVDHNSIGTNIVYLGVRIKYQ